MTLFIPIFSLFPVFPSCFGFEEKPAADILFVFDETRSASSENEHPDIIKGFEDEAEGDDENLPENEILRGFEDVSAPLKTEEGAKPGSRTATSLSGDVKLGMSYNVAHHIPAEGETDWRGLSRLWGELQMNLDIKFSDHFQGRVGGKGTYDLAYRLKGRDEFTNEVLKNNEKELELKEVYFLGKITKHLDVKLGRQIVVWGKSDNIRVTDVLNPLDLREPGLTDIEDLRLPVTMTRLDYYWGDWNLTGLALHEIRFNKLPEKGSDFFPGSGPSPHETIPDHGQENTEYAVSASGIFSGWDIAFYWADFFDDTLHFEPVSGEPERQIEMAHARLTMFGTAFNTAIGNWLFKAEAAYLDGFQFLNAPGRTFSRTDALAGLEYSGLKETILSIEAVYRHINDFEATLKGPPDNASEGEFQSVVRLTKTFRNETVTLTLFASTFGVTGQEGAFQRISMEQKITDSFAFRAGWVAYQSGNKTRFENIGDNDRIFLEIKYGF